MSKNPLQQGCPFITSWGSLFPNVFCNLQTSTDHPEAPQSLEDMGGPHTDPGLPNLTGWEHLSMQC